MKTPFSYKRLTIKKFSSYSFLLLLFLFSCHDHKKEAVTQIVKQWQGKEIVFSSNLVFTKHGKDTLDYAIPNSSYKILMYIDSVGCTSCKLHLHKWKEFINEVDSLTNRTVPILFFFHPKHSDLREVSYLLQRDGIDIPVCIDLDDTINDLNHFPTRQQFQTFLLDDDNKVLLIGNPIHNTRIKELYLSKISNGSYQDKATRTLPNTIVKVDKTEFDLGNIQKGDAKTIAIYIRNVGKSPFVVFNTRASCGCTLIRYDKRPTLPDSTAKVSITYNANDKGYFNKTVSIYGNIDNSPLSIKLKGTIE